MKENWETARLPLKDNDDHLFRVLEKVKSGYDKVGGRRGLTEADIEVLKKTTVNLAPQDWEKRILNDSLTSAAASRKLLLCETTCAMKEPGKINCM